MKTLLRTSGLVAALIFTVLTAGSAAITNPYGTCRTFCYNPSTGTRTQVSTQTTQSQCCSETYNPCPPGATPGGNSSFTPDGGVAGLCPITHPD
jgi:hypothetical protein